MALTLMYITNNIEIAKIAQKSGVDRIWVDLEYIGKEERQPGMDTVKSHHTVEDVIKLRPYITQSALMVRVNPIHNESEFEINSVLDAGADYIMLPMFKTKQEVQTFINFVNGRAKTILLVETAQAAENLNEILQVPGIDEVHVGINDLHLAYHKKFMFELLADGTVEKILTTVKSYGLPYGFGGIARIGHGTLPADMIIPEHYRLGSTRAILSRAFCNAENYSDYNLLEKEFCQGIINIREYEKKVACMNDKEFTSNQNNVKIKVNEIISQM